MLAIRAKSRGTCTDVALFNSSWKDERIALSTGLEGMLADAFEALVGAIYLDSCESLPAIVDLAYRLNLIPDLQE